MCLSGQQYVTQLHLHLTIAICHEQHLLAKPKQVCPSLFTLFSLPWHKARCFQVFRALNHMGQGSHQVQETWVTQSSSGENFSLHRNTSFCYCLRMKYNIVVSLSDMGFPGGAVAKNPPANAGGPRVRKVPWSRKQQPTPGLLSGKFHGQRSLEGYSRTLLSTHTPQ